MTLRYSERRPRQSARRETPKRPGGCTTPSAGGASRRGPSRVKGSHKGARGREECSRVGGGGGSRTLAFMTRRSAARHGTLRVLATDGEEGVPLEGVPRKASRGRPWQVTRQSARDTWRARHVAPCQYAEPKARRSSPCPTASSPPCSIASRGRDLLRAGGCLATSHCFSCALEQRHLLIIRMSSVSTKV